MNLSSMKKIAGDSKSTTFKHKDGHEIKVAHSALPALQRKQLEKLPIQHYDGGTDSASNAATDTSTNTSSNTSSSGPDLPGAQSAQDSFNSSSGNWDALKHAVGFAKGGSVPHYDSGTDNVSPPPASVYANQPIQTQSQSVPSIPNTTFGNGTLNAPAAFNLQQKSAREQQAVDSAKGAAQADIEDGYNKQQAALAQRDQDNINNLNNHTTEVTNAIKEGAINPNHYTESREAQTHIPTAMALALSGMTSSITGQPNYYADFLNKQIDRDIDAQKARSDQQKTIYGMYKDAYQNDTVAQDLAKKTMNDVYTHKMQQTAAQLATPQAKALADSWSAQKALENNQLLLNASQNASFETANPQKGSQLTEQGIPEERPPSVPYIDKNGKAVGMPAPGQNSTPQKSIGSKPIETDEDSFEKEGTRTTFPILAPGAEKFAKYGVQLHPFAKADAGEINSQIQQARQVEKVINGQKGDGTGGIHDLFQKMYSDSGRGDKISGLPGAVQRAGSKGLGAVASIASHILGGGVGTDVVSGAVGHNLSIPAMTQAQKSYETNQARLKTDLASGLKGLISVNDLDALVDKFTPGYADSPTVVKQKEDALVNSIKNAIKTDKLEQYNLLAKPKK